MQTILVRAGAVIPQGVTLTSVFAISGDGSAVVGMWIDAKSNVGTWIAYLPPKAQNLLTNERKRTAEVTALP